jgi:ubiquinone/menaquinone biosynthesis C-methylase UbiE
VSEQKTKSPFGRLLRFLLGAILALPLVAVLLHTVVRIVRHVHKFPIPEFAANLIDNPWRRRFEPPDASAVRHGLEPGMTVLEVGPGNGTYTVAAARRVGPEGTLVTVDIEPKMIERVKAKALAEGVTNIEARVANVYQLPFEAGMFDAIYMIAVIGEIPEPERAMREFYRVLAPGGTLAFSEILLDPDYPLARTLVALATSAGFCLVEWVGNFFYYTLIFLKR